VKFERFFRLLSYSAIFCGFLALWVSGSFGPVGTLVFAASFVGAWFLEDTRWQIPERPGTVLIVLAVPFYYLGWRSGFFDLSGPESRLPVTLAYLILSLTAVKLFQKKSDRDWVFLYLMAFFEVLLGAGLSISALYMATFVAFTFLMACVMVAFEIRKSAHRTAGNVAAGARVDVGEKLSGLRSRRIPASAAVLVTCIILIAAPLFFFLPRVGGAGMGSGRGRTPTSGFSDVVKLGEAGTIQQSDEVVMRVRITRMTELPQFIRWRGVALDTFNGNAWSRSSQGVSEQLDRGANGVVRVDEAANRDDLVRQTVYLEPLDRPVLFGLPRMIGVLSSFPWIRRDMEGGLSFPSTNERVSYSVISDPTWPSDAALRSDNTPYTLEYARYLALPRTLDPRIAGLAEAIGGRSQNRYDTARATEKYLQTRFGYTLDLRAGGPDPLADFLFNVREGHCEYFATAMAVMLRTEGIATRVVNGFQAGEYNDTADAFVVRQRNAHSWVEVYFPKENAWVPFDPTPYAGQNLTGNQVGIAARLNKYLEALEMVWIQYFVAFDNQEQRSLFSSFRRSVSELNTRSSSWTRSLSDGISDWWKRLRGDMGSSERLTAIGFGVGSVVGLGVLTLLFVWSSRKLVKSKFWRRLVDRIRRRRAVSVVEFYERMLAVLAGKGFERDPHQTPLEFAYAIGFPEAVDVTEKYNRVRFGDRDLTLAESDQIEGWLRELESPGRN
jgi:transglutaminase-like putative cysteine protease